MQEEVAELLKADKWFCVSLEARLLSRQRMAEKDPLETLKEGESLLLAGTTEGHLVILGQADGVPQYFVATGQGEVVAIVSSPRRRHVVTAGKGEAKREGGWNIVRPGIGLAQLFGIMGSIIGHLFGEFFFIGYRLCRSSTPVNSSQLVKISLVDKNLGKR